MLPGLGHQRAAPLENADPRLLHQYQEATIDPEEIEEYDEEELEELEEEIAE